MKIEGSSTINAPVPTVYAALQDERLIRAAMPGGLHFARTSPTTFEAAMEVSVPRFAGHYTGTVTITETEANRFYRLLVQGGAARQITATGTVALAPDERGTQVSYTGETDAADHLNRFMQAVVQRVAVEIINLGLRRLEAEIMRRQAPPSE